MAQDKAYREAERRVEKAQQNGVTKLDLSGMEFTEVPAALGQRCKALASLPNCDRLTSPES